MQSDISGGSLKARSVEGEGDVCVPSYCSVPSIDLGKVTDLKRGILLSLHGIDSSSR